MQVVVEEALPVTLGWEPTGPIPEARLAVHIGKREDVAVRDLAVPVEVGHLRTAVDSEVGVLIIEGAAVVVVDHATVSIVVGDDEVVMDGSHGGHN